MAIAGKKKAKKTAPRRGNAKPKPDFHRQTVLFQWALSKFGVDDLKQFRERFQMGPDNAGGMHETTGLHNFFEAIAGALRTVTDGNVVPVDRLQSYEQNILEHTQAINTARQHAGQPLIVWKYYQYLALLFTEMFLDRYFDDPADLRDEINETTARHNDRIGGASEPDAVAPFPIEPTGDDDADPRRQLARLAFWCATGSGKTLLMHVHIKQFKHYHDLAFKAGKWPKLDQIILVTPNDGLSDQHEKEFKWSGFDDIVTVGEAGADGLFAEQAKKAIKILSIHKFKEEHGKLTVATESFEGTNLVLVDEGHRGAGAGGEGAWLSRRNELADGGFTFEYSATFKEALGNDEEMRNRYARSILFDYAYRSFYRDGFGKDFTILNLEDDAQQRRYLTAALLLYYQQLRVWADGGDAMRPFLIDKPLWVFVGHTVTGGKLSNADDRVSVTDVVEVLLFIKQFLTNPTESVKLIVDLLDNDFVDSNGRRLLLERLRHIRTSAAPKDNARDIHQGIMRDVFHAPDGGALTVQLLKEAAGELALKVGEGEPFGVVNVGEPAAVAELCDKEGIVRLEDDVNRKSLFKGINRDDSPINLLVGSRKFTEGWNSWRVSSIGLMRMGRGEGTQIIQLFGRGVRLRGYQMSLRRSSVLTKKPPEPKNLRQVETLQVFGVKATYLSQFRDWIYSEVPEAMERQVWTLPVVKTLPDRRLRTIRIKEEIDGVKIERGQAFRRLGPIVKLRPPSNDRKDDWLRKYPTRLNWLPKVRGLVGTTTAREIGKIDGQIGTQVEEQPTAELKNEHIRMLDFDELLFGLESFKATRGLDRLYVDRAAIQALLAPQNKSWYSLLATDDDMRTDRYENRVQWQRMAQQLINTYAERFYRFTRGNWEAPYLEIADVSPDDPNLIESYTIETNDLAETADDITAIAELVTELRNAISDNRLQKWRSPDHLWRTVPFAGHLYQPLLYAGKNAQIKISPVALNKDEARFVEDLAEWCSKQKDKDVFLLRNQAVTGLSFFQASNFSPDFLLWVHDIDSEHLAFVDPKGLRHHDKSDPKLRFAVEEIPKIQDIVDRGCRTLKLHGFILSNTKYLDLNWSKDDGTLYSNNELEDRAILFQDDDPDTYINLLMTRIG